MRATVVVFPGSNAEAELVRTLRDVCGVATSVTWHRETRLPDRTDLVALPGGFSYGDDIAAGGSDPRAGNAGALHLRQHQPGLIRRDRHDVARLILAEPIGMRHDRFRRRQ